MTLLPSHGSRVTLLQSPGSSLEQGHPAAIPVSPGADPTPAATMDASVPSGAGGPHPFPEVLMTAPATITTAIPAASPVEKHSA